MFVNVYSGDVRLFHKLIIINFKIVFLNKFLGAQIFSDYIYLTFSASRWDSDRLESSLQAATDHINVHDVKFPKKGFELNNFLICYRM